MQNIPFAECTWQIEQSNAKINNKTREVIYAKYELRIKQGKLLVENKKL